MEKERKAKQPYRIEPPITDLFAFAGIWENWKNPQGGGFSRVPSLVNLPQSGAALHDRMPAILLPEEERLWIGPRNSKQRMLWS